MRHMKRLSLLLVLALAPPSWAQKVTLPQEVKAQPGLVTIRAETDCADLKWLSVDGLQLIPAELLKDSRVAIGIVPNLRPDQTGASYRVYAYGAKGDKASDPALCTVVVGTPGPGPTPPGPTPPVPPGPTPPNPPTPVPVTGFRVLFVYEATDGQPSLTKEQLNTIYSTQIREYLNRKCAKDDGRPGWRTWDKEVVLTAKESPTWKALWDAVKPQVKAYPSVVIVTDQKGEVFPLPATEAETLALLKKYGGE